MTPYSHSVVLGSTGTGKTECLYKNLLKIYSHFPNKEKPFLLFTDPKGDTAAYELLARKAGYKTLIYNFGNPMASIRYNFLASIYNDYHRACAIKKQIENNEIGRKFNGVFYSKKDEAVAAANGIMHTIINDMEDYIDEIGDIIIEPSKDPLWSNGAKTLFKAIVITLLRMSEDPRLKITKDHFTISNIARMAYCNDNSHEAIQFYMKKYASDRVEVSSVLGGIYGLAAAETRDSYLTSLTIPLSKYLSSTTNALTSSCDVDLADIVRSDEPYAIFVVTNGQPVITGRLCSLFMNQLINEAVNYAKNLPNNRLPRPFLLLADEFANMPPLPNMTERISTLRSFGVYLMMALQSIPQLDMVYKEQARATILDNVDLIFFLGSNNAETRSWVVDLFGETGRYGCVAGTGTDGSVSINSSIENTTLIKKSDLESLRLGEMYIQSRKSGKYKLRSFFSPAFLQDDASVWTKPLFVKYRYFDPNKNVIDLNKLYEADKPAPKKNKSFWDD